MYQSSVKLRALADAVMATSNRDDIKALFAEDGFKRTQATIVSDVFISPYGQLEITYKRREGQDEAVAVEFDDNNSDCIV